MRDCLYQRLRVPRECVTNAVTRGLQWTILKGKTWCEDHLIQSLDVLFGARPSGMNSIQLAVGLEFLGDLLMIVDCNASALRIYRRGIRVIRGFHECLFRDDIALVLQMAGKTREARREVALVLRMAAKKRGARRKICNRFSVSRGIRICASGLRSIASVDREMVWQGRMAEKLLAGNAQLVLDDAEDVPLEQSWDLQLGAHAILRQTEGVYRILEDLRRERIPIRISHLVVFVLPDELLDSPSFWRALGDCIVMDCLTLFPTDVAEDTASGLHDAESFARAMLDIHIARTSSDRQLLEAFMATYPNYSYPRKMNQFWISNSRPPTWHELLRT